MSENTLDYHNPGGDRKSCYLRVTTGRGQECCSALHNAQDSLPTTRCLVAPNVTSAEAVKPLARGKVTKLGYGKVGENWKVKRLEGTITSKMVLTFHKQMCKHRSCVICQFLNRILGR